MLSTIVRDIWVSRELLVQLTKRDLKLRYRQAIMGFAWALFLPILTISAGLIVRMLLSQSGSSMAAPSIGGITIKSWGWAFFSGALSFATISLINNAQLVTKIYFPREVLPLSALAAQVFDSCVGLTLLLLLGPWLGFHWSVQLVWLPLLLLTLLLIATGLSLLLAAANLFFRDVKYILQVLLTFGIFFTPVLYEPTGLKGKIGQLLMFNPLSPVLEGLRLTLVERQSLLDPIVNGAGIVTWSPWFLGYSLVVGLAATLGGMIAFRKSAAYFAEYY